MQADHEDTEVVSFNRMMLPTYYGLLKMCCEESKSFRRQLAQHQNIQWAFKNITPYYTQYTMACEELFKLMSFFVKPFKKVEGKLSVWRGNFIICATPYCLKELKLKDASSKAQCARMVLYENGQF